MKWLWTGPKEGGITQTMIGHYLTDPFTFFLYYGLGVEEPSQAGPNLIWGQMFHVGIEHVLKNPLNIKEQPSDYWDGIFDTVNKVGREYSAPDTFSYSVINSLKLYNDSYKTGSIQTEVEFKHEHSTEHNKVTLRGKLDGYFGSTLIEHKCKKQYDRNIIKQELPWDTQVNIYSYVFNLDTVIYDLIRIPEVQWNLPQRKLGERASFYVDRLYHTHFFGDYPIAKKKFAWIDQLHVPINVEVREHWIKTTLNPIIDRICEMYNYTSQSDFDWENPSHYNIHFYRQPLRHFNPANTEKFTRPYHTYLTGQIPFTSLKKINRIFNELEEQ